MVDGVQADANRRARRPLPADEQRVEAAIEREQRRGAHAGELRPPRRDAPGEPERGERAQPVADAEVERARAAAALEHELRPGNPAAREVRPQYRRERPGLQVPALEERVEGDPRAVRGEPQAELDVLDGGRRVPVGVEAAGGEERLAPDRAEPSPERLRRPGALLVHVVVEEVPEARHEPGIGRVVVVGAEERVEAGVGGEGRAHAREGVPVRFHVGVDEDEEVASRAADALVPGGGRAGCVQGVDHDYLLRRLLGGPDRSQAARERRRSFGRRDDRREPSHRS